VFLQLFIRYNWFAKHLINTHWCLHTFNYLKTANEILVKAQDTEYFVCARCRSSKSAHCTVELLCSQINGVALYRTVLLCTRIDQDTTQNVFVVGDLDQFLSFPLMPVY
jgi:hypothetical protein